MELFRWNDEGMVWHKSVIKRELISLSLIFSCIFAISLAISTFTNLLPLGSLIFIFFILYVMSSATIISQIIGKYSYGIDGESIYIYRSEIDFEKIVPKEFVVKKIKFFEEFNVIGLQGKRKFYYIYIKSNSPEWSTICELMNIKGT